MSHNIIHQAIRDYRKFTTPLKSLMHTLVTYGNSEGKNIFPGRERLAADENCTVVTIIRRLKLLETNGFIVTTDKKGGRGRVTHYEIVLEKLGIELERDVIPEQTPVTVPIIPPTNGVTPHIPDMLQKKYERREFLQNAVREFALKQSPNEAHYRERLAKVEAEIAELEKENLQNASIP